MSLRLVSALSLLGLALLLTAGCAVGGTRLPFAADARQSQTLRRARGTAGGEWYALRRPVIVGPQHRALVLRYRGDPRGAELVVYASPTGSRLRRPLPPGTPGTPGGALARRVLPAAQGAEAVAYLPLPAGSYVGALAVEPAGAGLRLVAAGLGPELHGLLRGAEGLHFGPEVAGFSESAGSCEVLLAAEAPLGAVPERWQLLVEYTVWPALSWAEFRRGESDAAAGPEPAAGPAPRSYRVAASVQLADGERRLALRHQGLAGGQRLALPGPLVGFEPRVLALRAAEGANLSLSRLDVAPIGFSAEPIVADPGAILMYPRDGWRQPEYELFVWSRRPEILIMDTASYTVQSLFFKRLAFFVEKSGYRGRLLTDEQFAGLHGYNAHDYRAEDLARFFQEARRQRFALNAEEQLLERILVANGVLREADEPGVGGILSISRTSPPLLRQQLLTHECYHGLYFVLPDYREAAQREWRGLQPLERSFWELFFSFVGYDTTDPYLAANEYQSYLFQQERGRVDGYFRSQTAPRLAARYPSSREQIQALLTQLPRSFTEAFDRLEPELVRQAGVEGGRVIELSPSP